MFDEIKAGPTGEFPEGKLRDDDKGEIRIAVGVSRGAIVIDFGKPVTWLGMPPAAARDLAANLIRKACALDGEPFVLKL